ncbi:NAD(+) diphosphatase [Alkalimonas collagenimarina]|uniref:NAD(+) diphosphatase n=1 Tax=Alkalimonas collagenimarina TaxID=400390 RepID=A0ABT9GZT5_9GAMM|nr:NAD(+) diphosphatase [Alkalimonas collagenimarina]MDP4536567.1 NAD(+) diphosphatase [Alkalimonas collagenimarina]
MISHSFVLQPERRGYWLVVNRQRLYWPAEQTELWLTTAGELARMFGEPEQSGDLGQLNGQPVFYWVVNDQRDDEHNWQSPRALLAFGDGIFQLAARAVQVALFIQTHRYCGQCGSAMHLVSWELAALCSRCGHRCYPRIAPCVLIAVVKDDQLLLARSTRHKTGFFSILAGFVESAETLEQAAVREVKEEVGIDITDLQYVGSQPWPFPHSLMTGFIARYQSGDIKCQPNEIEEAYWFDVANLPEIPPVQTLSGQMIAQVVNTLSK